MRPRRTSARALRNKEVIIGFGHPVYTVSDPRNQVIKEVARRLAKEAGDIKRFEIADAHRGHDGGHEEDVRQPRLVLGGVL